MDSETIQWSMNVEYSLKNVHQIAYDWLSNNFYFTDEHYERIFLCRGDDVSVCVTVVSVDLKPPSSIGLDPWNDRMFFVVLGESPRIESSTLIGTDRRHIVHSKQIVRPLGLTLDAVKQHVYWSDVYLGRIERVNYDGTERRLIIRRLSVEFLNSLVLHERYLYGTSFRNNCVVQLDRRTGLPVDDRLVLFANVTGPTAIRVINQQQQPVHRDFVNPCRSSRCNHVCVTERVNGSFIAQCLCRAGFRLDDSDQCKLIQEDQILLYSNAKLGEIRGISLQQSLKSSSTVDDVIRPIAGIERPVAIDYHAATQFVYFSDAVNDVIGRRKIHGTDTEMVILSGIRNCEGIAIDWVARNLYWTDEELKTVSVARLDKTTYQCVLFNTDLSHPRAIALSPADRLE
jgi:integrin beta 2